MAQMMTDVSFGPVFVTAPFPLCITIYISYKHQLVSKKKKKKNKKNSLMAQMMTDVSFRPVFVTATLPVVYYNIYIL